MKKHVCRPCSTGALFGLLCLALIQSPAWAQADSTYSSRSKRSDSVAFPTGSSTPGGGAATGYSLVVQATQVFNALPGRYITFGPFTNASSAVVTVTVIATNDNSVGCLTLNGANFGCTGKGASLSMPVAPQASFSMTLKDGERVAMWANQSGLSASTVGVPGAVDFANPTLVSSAPDPSANCLLIAVYSDGSRFQISDPSPTCASTSPGGGGG